MLSVLWPGQATGLLLSKGHHVARPGVRIQRRRLRKRAHPNRPQHASGRGRDDAHQPSGAVHRHRPPSLHIQERQRSRHLAIMTRKDTTLPGIDDGMA